MHLNLKNDIDNATNKKLENNDINAQKQFWRNMFEEPTEMSELLKSREPDQECIGKTSVIETRIDNVSSISDYCSTEGIDRRSYFAAVFAVVLGNSCRQANVIFGAELPSKQSINEKCIVPVRIDISGDISLADYIYAVNNMLCEAANNTDVSIKEIMAITGHSYENELFRSVYRYHKEEEPSNPVLITDAQKGCTYSFEVVIDEKKDCFELKVIYDQSIYSPNDIRIFIDHIRFAAENMVTLCDKKISEFEIVTTNEKSLILNDFNATSTDYPRDKTIVELFEEQVKKTPDNIALVFEDQKLTYAELNARANSLAYKLRELGVKPDDFVAVVADKSVEVIAGIFGILKSGGAYVPVDPKYPAERISFMLEDCAPKAIVRFTSDDVQLPENTPVIDLANADIWMNSADDPDRINTSHDLAYCIYTSGTTGKPKGVMIEHYGVANLREYFIQKQGVCEEDNVIQFASISFDAAVSEMTMGLLCGATMHMIPAEIQKDTKEFENYIADNKISIAILPPVYLTQVNLKGLRTIITAGSETNKGLVEANKHIPVYSNDYGPTEGTVCATFWKHDSREEVPDRIPIGKPMNNKQIYIMNGDTLCGIGVPGELCIAGDGLARGYLNRPELTAEKFVKNPYGEGRMYRTGDLARWLPDGNIEYLGRIDEQVKIRGFRIELGEIETKIRDIKNIKDCAVIAKADASGDKAIYAYYTSDIEVSVSEIRDRLSESLPEYMVPAYMMQIEEVPVTRNGKVDRRALPEIEAKGTREYVPPRNEIEEKICAIFSEILNVEQVGIKDSFFELGGHSLRATRLVNRIEAETGTRIALKDVFAHPTAEQLAVLAGGESEEYIPIPKAEEKEYYPMSSVQKRMFILNEVGSDLSYNLPEAFVLHGKLDIERFRKSVKELVKRHDSFRTEFGIKNGEYVQIIKENVDFDIDIRSIEDADNRSISDLFFGFVKPFDLTKAPIARIQLIKYSDDKFLVMYDMHHIIFDGMSQIILMEEFIDLYNGENLKPVKIQYKDYSTWLNGQDFSKHREFWMNEFEDGIPVVEFPTDYPRPQKQSFNGHSISLGLSNEIVSMVEKLSAMTGTTEYMVWLSVLMIVLSKYSRQEDIVVGSPISGRTNRDTEGIVGMFVNTLVMRGKPEGNKSYREFLSEIKNTCLRGYENQDYPFESLVEDLDVKKDSSRNPIFDVMFVLQNNEPIEKKMNGISECRRVTETGNTSMFDLTIEIQKLPEASLRVEYCVDLFKYETVEFFVQHYIGIIDQIINNIDIKLGNISLCQEMEKHLILNDFNTTETDYPRDKTVVELFEEQVKKTPDNIALVFEDKKLTYAELNARANSLAHKLRELGVKPDDFVAIIADRSIEMIAGIYGIIKAGGAYVPIDPTYPEDRIEFMMEDCAPKAVVIYTSENLNIPENIKIVDLSDSSVWNNSSEDPEHVNKPSDLAYCIYTSGTTGKPKGTMLEHHGVVNLKYYFANRMGINDNDRVLQFANYIFDASVWEMTMALLNGATLVCVPAGLAQDTKAFNEYCAEKEVTVATLPPNYYVQEDVKLNLRLIITAGSESNKFILEKSKNGEYINAYGPTETTVCATYWRRPEGFEGTVAPIGVPIDNFKTYIMNGDSLCGIGVPGELCIAGDGLARGYLNRPDLTAEKFVKNPFGEGRMYRSGDLARWLPDGNIEYLGRIDEQVKIRGFRIELGEIESRIREIENIKDCAVIAKADASGDKAIYAYYTSDNEVSVSDIRDRLAETLPEYMVPAYMMQIEEIPVTRNGKLDKRALPEIEARATREYVAPRNEIEEKICAIFSEILNVEQVGVKDSFFELGGHSLRATRLVNRIEAETGTRIALKEVFAHPTAEQLAVLAGGESEEYVPILKAEEKEYYPMSSVQKRTYYIQQMRPEAVTYNIPINLKLTGCVDVMSMKDALQKMTDRHEILRTQFLMINGEPVQKILDHVEADFEYVTSNESDERLMRDFLRPFDLASGKLIRIKLVNKGEYHLMMLDMHHIVSDGMSVNTIINELTVLYNGGKIEALTHQFKDYSEWMRSRDLSGQEEYWKSQFDDEIPVLDMPTDFPRPQEQSYAGTMITEFIDEELSGKIKELVKKTGATEYMVFLAAAMVTLSKYSRQEDIVIGSPISGRTHRDTEGMLGMFVNTLAMRGRPEKDKTFSQFLEEIRNTCLKAYENQEYPFEELVEAVDVQRDMSRNPLFDVMLVMQNNEEVDFYFNDCKAETTSVECIISKFDLTFYLSESDGRYSIVLEYCTDLFKAETASRLIIHFEQVLREVTANSEKKLCEIEMVTDDEKRLIFNGFNATAADYPYDKTVVELFEEQARKTPDKIALIGSDKRLSYKELNEEANILAHKLREIGIGADDFVAVISDRNTRMIEAVYAVLKAGGVYVPIDPTYPDDRISFMLEDCQPKAILLCTAENVDFITDITVIDMNDPELWKGDTTDLKRINGPYDHAYCIYTSGTTGKPKGAAIFNVSFMNLVAWYGKEFGFNEKDVNLYIASLCFDLGQKNIFTTLIAGGTLIVADVMRDGYDRLSSIIDKEKVTVINCAPSVFNQIVKENEGNDYLRLSSVERVFLGGEPINAAALRDAVISDNTQFRIINTYGPTECTDVVSSYAYVNERIVNDEVIPIGKPNNNNQICIYNGLDLCGIDVPGELCITGICVSGGYINRPELTAEKFVKDPMGSGMMYRTGDLARWQPDGNIEYLGRIDEQVKIHGFRIELGEIENRIREITEIKDCAVIAKPDSSGEKAIYAYYTSEDTVSVSYVREKLSEQLPEYMIPTYIMQIDSIPVTKNGKLDRRALPDINAVTAMEYVAPKNETEEILCSTFAEFLGVDKVGIKDNFFALGGDSIKAIRIISKLRYAGIILSVKDIMNNKTAEKIALHVEQATLQQRYDQSEVSGDVINTPIMDDFNKWNLAVPSHFNQATMFNVDGLDNETIKRIMTELVKHHDMLRCVCRDGRVSILPIAESKLFDFYEFDYSMETDKYTSVKNKCSEIQADIDLENGPVVKVAVFELGDAKRMMISVHHFAIDGISWRILCEDFETAVKQLADGKDITLPEKTASFIEWSKKLKEYKEYIDDEKIRLFSRIKRSISDGKVKWSGGSSDMGSVFIEFDEKVTDDLLKKCSEAYGAKVNEIMLAALAKAINSITGQEKLAVRLEGHGREEIHEPVVIDRTVGWFTNIYAVNIDCTGDDEKLIVSAKDTVRAVPNSGIGYAYADVGEETIPDICFNYLGDFSQNDGMMAYDYSCGNDISEKNILPDKISINANVGDGKLVVEFASFSHELGRTFIERLTDEYKKTLAELIDHCCEGKDTVQTASDMCISYIADNDISFINSLID